MYIPFVLQYSPKHYTCKLVKAITIRFIVSHYTGGYKVGVRFNSLLLPIKAMNNGGGGSMEAGNGTQWGVA